VTPMAHPPSRSDEDAEIIRLHFAEHWRVGTIATQLGVHPDRVRRVLGLDERRARALALATPRPVAIDPFRAFVVETLTRYPRLCATRLFDMLRERGYTGGVRSVRRFAATVRPRPRREIFLHTEPLIGEQAQVDWAYVGKLPVPGGERALWLFVIVLAYSRALWAEFVFDLSVHSLCRSLVRAARAFGGVPRQWLFDNPKVVVLERRGDAVRFHPVLLDLAAALRVQPRLCAVARPEHKGKVERAIRYLRDRFLAGRTITGVADGNHKLDRFLVDVAHARPHPALAPRTVADVFSDERSRLLALPDPLPDTDLVAPAVVDRQAFVRFDTNRYSVPSTHADHPLTLVADDTHVRVLDGAACIARHERVYGKRQVIEVAAHRAALLVERRAAADLKGRDRLRAVAPDFHVLLDRWALSGPSLGLHVTRAIKLLDLYGDDVFAAAVSEIVARGLRDTGALAVACDRVRRDRGRPVPVDVTFAAHVDDLDVIPHDLGTYDADE
jgi:transposase